MKTFLQLALVVLTSATAFAQWAKVPPTPLPRTADGKPNLSAPAPRRTMATTTRSWVR